MMPQCICWCAAIGLALVCTPIMAEPIKSENLCAKPGDAIRVTIPEHLAGNHAATGSVGELASRIEKNREPYFAKMEETSPFSGLYFRGQTDQSLSNGNNRSAYALEWELFKQGRDESRKGLGKAKIERQVQYYQLLRDMEERQLHENLFRLQQIRNKVVAFIYDKEATRLKSLYDRLQQALANGYVTREDVEDMAFKVERATLKQAYNQSASQLVLSSQEYALINQIESVLLRPSKDLLELAIAHSYEYRLQASFVNRSEYFPTWTDNLSLGFYLEQSHEFNRSNETITGVRIRIPLENIKSHEEIAAIERHSYIDQQQAVALRLAQKIALLSDRLHLRQNDLKLLNKEYQLLRTKTELACYQIDFPVTAVDVPPERKVEELTIYMFEKERDILLARMDILEIMTEFSALIKPEKTEDWYLLQ